MMVLMVVVVVMALVVVTAGAAVAGVVKEHTDIQLNAHVDRQKAK